MRIILSMIVSLGIAFGMYLIVIHSMTKTLGGSPATATATVTVQMQLVNLAQAERMHFVQNNSYATIDELRSNDEFKTPSPDPNGYVYTVEITDGGFKATAQHAAATGTPDNFPAFTVDQGMQVQRVDAQPDSTDKPAEAAKTSDDTKHGDTANAGDGNKADELPSFPSSIPMLPAGLVSGAKTSAASQDSAPPSN